MRPIIHILLHFLAPAIIAKFAYPQQKLRAWIIMMLTMAVDLDHFFASPIYDPNRCGIGFHPLHSYWAISFYIALLFIPKLRIIGVGLVIHMALDIIDCVWIGFF